MATPTNGSAQAPSETALAQAEALVAQADDVRSRLHRERQEHMAAVAQIDAMLGRLPAKTAARVSPATAPKPQRGSAISRAKTLPDVVLAIVRETPGLTSTAIVEATLGLHRRGVKAPDVHASLWRLKKRGTLRVEGERGSLRYFAVEAEAATA
jgi:hypothetical protein